MDLTKTYQIGYIFIIFWSLVDRSKKHAIYTKSILNNSFVNSIATHLVISLVPVLNAQIEGVQLHLEMGSEQLLLDQLPDDPGHLVAEDLHQGTGADLAAHGDSGLVEEN